MGWNRNLRARNQVKAVLLGGKDEATLKRQLFECAFTHHYSSLQDYIQKQWKGNRNKMNLKKARDFAVIICKDDERMKAR